MGRWTASGVRRKMNSEWVKKKSSVKHLVMGRLISKFLEPNVCLESYLGTS